MNLEPKDYLSIYAAVLSTVVFIWNIVRTIPRFKVDLGVGINDEGGEINSGIFIIVKNPSPHSIHMGSISILYSYGEMGILGKIIHALKYRRIPHSAGWVSASLSMFEVDDKCPVAIEPFSSHSVFVDEEVVKKIVGDDKVKYLKASAQDLLFRDKYSSKLQWP